MQQCPQYRNGNPIPQPGPHDGIHDRAADNDCGRRDQPGRHDARRSGLVSLAAGRPACHVAGFPAAAADGAETSGL